MAVLARAAAQQPMQQLPRFSGLLAPLNAALGTIERAMFDTVRRGQEPAFPSILLASPNGTAWRVSVGDDGALAAVPVPRG